MTEAEKKELKSLRLARSHWRYRARKAEAELAKMKRHARAMEHRLHAEKFTYR